MSIVGVLIGRPEPRVKRSVRATSNSCVTSGRPSSIRHSLAVVPPMSNDIRSLVAVQAREPRGRERAGGRPGLEHPDRAGRRRPRRWRRRRWRASRAGARPRRGRSVAPRDPPGSARRGPARTRSRRSSACARTRGSPARRRWRSRRAGPGRHARPPPAPRARCPRWRSECRKQIAIASIPRSASSPRQRGHVVGVDGLLDRAVRERALGDVEAQVARDERLGPPHVEPVDVGAALARELDHVAEARPWPAAPSARPCARSARWSRASWRAPPGRARRPRARARRAGRSRRCRPVPRGVPSALPMATIPSGPAMHRSVNVPPISTPALIAAAPY